MQNGFRFWENIKTQLNLLLSIDIIQVKEGVVLNSLTDNPIQQSERSLSHKVIWPVLDFVQKRKQVWLAVFFLSCLSTSKLVLCKLKVTLIVLCHVDQST